MEAFYFHFIVVLNDIIIVGQGAFFFFFVLDHSGDERLCQVTDILLDFKSVSLLH